MTLRKLSVKQAAIINALQDRETITLTEATGLIGRNYYCSAEKNTGVVLSNMVKRGLIVRVKPGVFKLP